MRKLMPSLAALALGATLVAVSSPSSATEVGTAPAASRPQVAFAPIGTYDTGLGEASAEIVAYGTGRAYVVNATSNTLDVVDLSDPTAPTLLSRVDLAAYGASVNSVDVRDDLVAVVVEAEPKTDPGTLVLLGADGTVQASATVGALPDMVTFTPGGGRLLVANEGEPSDDYAIDPPGSVSVIGVNRLLAGQGQRAVSTIGFEEFDGDGVRSGDIPPGVRRFGPGASFSEDVEPEFITVAPDNGTAWVTLQENNAIATLDLRNLYVDRLLPIEAKGFGAPGAGLDASDADGADGAGTISIEPQPVVGLQQPDGIANFAIGGSRYLIMANEGDSRDYDGYSEEARVGDEDFVLDPALFPNAAELKDPAVLGRLRVSNATGDTDLDGDFDRIEAFGGRSFSIMDSGGGGIFDSGDQLEQLTAVLRPELFNSEGEADGFDSRSDDKGPEPEGITVGQVGARTYAFVALERIGGVVIYDITDPEAPLFVQYTNSPGDLGPEGLEFVPRKASPNGRPLLLVANEISGTVTIYEGRHPDGAGSLTLLHTNDGESSLLPLTNGVGDATLPVGGVAAYESVIERERTEARAAGNDVVNVYAGDAILASAALSCSLAPFEDVPLYDSVAQRQMGFDAHVFGNHEFDYSPDLTERFVRDFQRNGVLVNPFLSANLGFGGEPGFDDLVDIDGIIAGTSSDGRVVARSTIVTDAQTGQRYGVVGATTPDLPTISTPRNVTVTPDLESTAALVQTEVDRLTRDFGIRRVIFASQLQDIGNDQAFVGLLRGVDIAIAGGGNELLTNDAIPDDQELLPGEMAEPVGPYPLVATGADGNPVRVVTTAGNYKYVGRLDVSFDDEGIITSVDGDESFTRRVVPEGPEATASGVTDAVAPDAGITSSVIEPVTACLESQSVPIVETEVLLDVSRAGVRSTETNAGNLVADSYLAAYDRYAESAGLPPRGADNPVVAIQNGGGIRQNAGDVLPVGGIVPGTISRLDTRNVLAFFNTMSVVESVSPANLEAVFERSGSTLTADGTGQGGQFLQVGGLSVTFDPSQPAQEVTEDGTVTVPGNRVTSITLADGTPIVENSEPVAEAPDVSVITNTFTAAGGDNYPTLAADPDKTQLFDPSGLTVTYEQVWVDYLSSLPATGTTALPTVPADDPRYAPGGEGRIVQVPTP